MSTTTKQAETIPAQTISISQDGALGGEGTIQDGRITCSAVLGPDPSTGEQQGAAERAYDAIEAAIQDGQDSATVDGIRYTWDIYYEATDLRDLPDAERIDIYEDNGGGLYLHPVGQGIVIAVVQTGDALTDCRTYGTDWDADDCPDEVYPARPDWLDEMDRIAAYCPRVDELVMDSPGVRPGLAGTAYLGYDEWPLREELVDELRGLGVTVLYGLTGDVVCADEGPGFRASTEAIEAALNEIRGRTFDRDEDRPASAVQYEAFHDALHEAGGGR